MTTVPNQAATQPFGSGFLAGDRPSERGTEIAIDDDTTPRRLVLRTMGGAKRYTIWALILLMLHFAGEALVPVIMGLAIDRAVLGQDWGALALWLAILAANFIMLSLTWRFGSRLAAYGYSVIEHQYRMRVTDRMLDPAGSDGPARLPGTALSIATSDVSRLSRAVLLGIFPISEIFAVMVAGVILLTISWPLGLVVLVGAPLMFWLLDRVGAPLRARTARQQESVGVAAGLAGDLVAGFRVLKGIGAEREGAHRYRRASARARVDAISAMRGEGAYVAVVQSVSAIFVIAVGVAAGVMAVHGEISVGQLITAVGLTQVIMGPLNALGANFGAVWNGAIPSGARVLSVLQATPLVVAGDRDQSGGSLTISGLPTGGDLHIPETGITAIVADQGTVRHLTAAMAREEDGLTITVGQTALRDLDSETGRATLRVIPRSPHLFEGSVLDNIAAGSSGAAENSDVTRAIFAAACDDVAEVLPEGLDTPVGEAGRMLSGGQRQRVSLARALAAPSRFLVLDDPTTAVDSVTEAAVVERVRAARAAAATIVFTASPAWLAAADTVIRLSPIPQEVSL